MISADGRLSYLAVTAVAQILLVDPSASEVLRAKVATSCFEGVAAAIVVTSVAATGRSPDLPPWASLQVTQIDLEAIENAPRLICRDHHHIHEFKKCVPAEVDEGGGDLDRDGAVLPRDLTIPFGREGIHQRCGHSVRVSAEEAFDSSRGPVLYPLSFQGQP